MCPYTRRTTGTTGGACCVARVGVPSRGQGARPGYVNTGRAAKTKVLLMSRTSLGQAWRAALELVVVQKPVAKPVGRWAVGDGAGNAFRRADQGSWDNGAVAHRGCGESRGTRRPS